MDEKKKKIAKKITLGVMLSACAIYMLFAIVHFNNVHDNSLCTGVDINIKDSAKIQFVHRGDVNRVLQENDSDLYGRNLERINTTKIERVLSKRLLAIKEVECYKTPEGRLEINIWQRHPLLRIEGATGNGMYLDDEGQLMPNPCLEPAYVPIASGTITERFATGPLFKFAKYLHDNDFWNAQIEQIYVKAHNEVALVPRVGPQIIEMGTLDSFEVKLNKLEKLYEHALPIKGWNNYAIINLKYDKQIICTKK